VSGTMLVARMAGIEVFVTGGVGGVHRGGQDSMDVSADLTELGKTPVAVVCAGVKSILDIGRTLEFLETQGVCVATLGPSNAFPAFYTADSGFKAPHRLDSPGEAAELIKASSSLGLSSGILLGVPIPSEEAAAGAKIETAIKTALKEADARGISGREITPFILSRLNELTQGESLRANLALVRNNAKTGADIAVELSRLRSKGQQSVSRRPSPSSKSTGPLVVGGSIFDFVVRLKEGEVHLNGSTHKGTLASSHGGVGRNVASALSRLGADPRLASAVGNDDQGRGLTSDQRLDTSLVKVVGGARTAAYTALLDAKGECQFGIGDMDIHAEINPEYVEGLEKEIASAPLVVADGNMPQESLLVLMSICHKNKVPLFYEPTDLRKARLPLSSPIPSAMVFTSPNLGELKAMLEELPGSSQHLPKISSSSNESDVLHIAREASKLIAYYGISVLLVTMSEAGVLLVRQGLPDAPLPLSGQSLMLQKSPLSAVWYKGQPCPATSLVSVSGAGDCLAAGFIAAALKGLCQDSAVAAGLQAAKHSCTVSAAVPEVLEVSWGVKAEGIRLI